MNTRRRGQETGSDVEISQQVNSIIALGRAVFADSLVAVYLHGSAVHGGLRPHSDLDFLVIVNRPIVHASRTQLAAGLMEISSVPGELGHGYPIELIVFLQDELERSDYPVRCEFMYGEWLRESIGQDAPYGDLADPELTLILAQARQAAVPLTGPGLSHFVPEVSAGDVRRAIGDALPPLLDTLEGDERNVLLTLARMWRTLITDEFIPKDEAARWAAARLPEEQAAVLRDCGDIYLGLRADDLRDRMREVRSSVNVLCQRISETA